MSTLGPAANDNARPRLGAGTSVVRRYSTAVEESPSPPPGRWPRVRRLVAWVGGALVILTAVGTAAVVVRLNHAFAAPRSTAFLLCPVPAGSGRSKLGGPDVTRPHDRHTDHG